MTRKTTRENAKRDRRRDQYVYVDDLRVGDIIYDKAGEATVISVSDSDQRGYRNVEVAIDGGRKTFRYYGESTVPIKRRVSTARETGDVPNAEAAGEQYANDQLQGDYFMDWVREQMAEAERADPSQMLPLETKSDALVIAKNMLQQLLWDTREGLDNVEIARLSGASSLGSRKEFFNGFQKTLDASRDWLADELLQIKQEMHGGGVGEARRGVVAAPRRGSSQKYKPSKNWRFHVVDRIVPSHGAHRVEFNDGLSIQVHGGSGRDDLLYAMRPVDMRLEQRSPGPESRREYQYAALKAVLGDRPADFVVDHDGDVRAILTSSAIGVREARRGARRSSKPLRYSDEQVRAMLAQVPMYREQLLAAAKERGWDRSSVVPITEVHAFLRAQLAAKGVGERRHPKAAGSARRHSRSPTRRSRA